MPRADERPDNLKELSYRNAVELSHARWDSDVQLLIEALAPLVRSARASPASTSGSTSASACSRKYVIAGAAVLVLAASLIVASLRTSVGCVRDDIRADFFLATHVAAPIHGAAGERDSALTPRVCLVAQAARRPMYYCAAVS